MDLEQFVREGWDRHGEDAEGVFQGLSDGLALVTEATP